MLCYNCMREKGDATVCPFCQEPDPIPLPHHLHPGYQVGNRYTLGRVLGEGGFGITYIGRSNTLEVTVAVKEYYPCGCCNRNATVDSAVTVTSEQMRPYYEQGRARFLREAKTLARFHEEPGIVNVIDFIEENNTAYIVMEYLDGVNLREYLRQHGTVEPAQAVQMLMPMMKALQKVHAAGVIHRDISPDNIMMLKNGSLKLMDFGAARDYDGDNRSMSVMLKQGYAPEEQYRRNGEQGPWTDVYGVCATLYRLMTGRAPAEAMDRVHQDTLQPPSALGVPISPAMESTLMYGLAIYKENRCPDMGTLISLLERSLTGAPVSAPSSRSVTRQPYDDPDQTVLADGYMPTSQGYRPPSQGYQPPVSEQRYAPQPEKKQSNAPIIAAICFAAVVIIAAILIIIVMLNKNDSSDTASDTASVAPVVSDAADDTQTMPDLVGHSKQNAIDTLAGMNLSVAEFIETESDEQSPGTVFNQVPQSGSSVTENTKITLYIAAAKATEAPTEAPKPTEAPAPPAKYSSNTYLYCTAQTYVALHASASTGSATLGKIWSGQSVRYISSSGDWEYVEAGGVTGYAYASYLSSDYSRVPYSSGATLKVNSGIDFLSLRASDSENSTELAQIPPGASITFMGSVVDHGYIRSDGYHVQWAYVKYGSQYGYVYDYYVHD